MKVPFQKIQKPLSEPLESLSETLESHSESTNRLLKALESPFEGSGILLSETLESRLEAMVPLSGCLRIIFRRPHNSPLDFLKPSFEGFGSTF